MAYMPAVLVAAGVAALSLVEASHAPRVPVSDKWSHGIAYLILAVSLILPLLYRGYRSWRAYLWTVVSCTAYGLLMEALQRFCTLTRTGEMADLLADFLGALLGVVIVAIVMKITSRLVS